MVRIVAEAGINAFFGSDKSEFIPNIKKLISIASVAGCTHFKLQKRNPHLSTPENKKNELKKVPWREDEITYLDYKIDCELNFDQHSHVKNFCEENNIKYFSSVWDEDSVEFMNNFTDIIKIPSALITNKEVLDLCNEYFDFKIMSTGMSTEEEIEKAVDILKPQVIMHTNSVYPTPVEDLHLQYIKWLREKYPKIEIGFSNHYYGIVPLIATVLLDVQWIEFHITLNHENFGSDQSASIEPNGIFKAVKGIRDLEKAKAKGYEPRNIYPGEEKKRSSLRR